MRSRSATSLEHVVVPPAWTEEGENGAPEGLTTQVRRQTYSLTHDGVFTFQRSEQVDIGHLEVRFEDLDERRAKKHDATPFSGVLLERVGGTAAAAGLRKNDVVESFGGKNVRSAAQFRHLIRSATPGDTVDLGVRRKGQDAETLRVEIDSETEIRNAKGFQTRLDVLDDRSRSGLKLVELTDETHPLVVGPDVVERGLLVLDVLPGGPAFHGKIFSRDYLIQVGGHDVSSIADYLRALEGLGAGDDVVFVVRRDGGAVETEIELDDDATVTSGFDIWFMAYRRSSEETEFSLINEIVFDYESRRFIQHGDERTTYASRGEWGMVLNLIHYEGSPFRKTLKLLWIIPLTFYRSSD